ncbi:glucose-6-phosphate isomerase [Pillotina sp. SPG140]
MQYNDFDKTSAYRALAEQAARGYTAALTAERVRDYELPMAATLRYSYAAKHVDEAILNALQSLADEQEVTAKYQALLNGDIMNTGENRKVLHHLTRGQLGKAVLHNGRDLGVFYAQERSRIAVFAKAVHSGAMSGSTGKAFTTVVQIGIGGSDLGPRALYLALEQWADVKTKKKLNAQFISNVDPDDASAVLNRCSLEETLFILVSKSGTTQETLANELFVKAQLIKAGLDPRKHIIAVTSETSPLAHNPDYLESFYIDDFIGGRYSSTSAVGGVVLSLAFGTEVFADVLAGAHEADIQAKNPSIKENAALLDALIGVWERNFLNYPCTAVLPYSQALSRFPAHLQQLDMESNGKRVNRNGEPLGYKTGPVVFGEPGTNGQHSFYQLLHQGTNIVPLQFIGFKESQRDHDIDVHGSSSQTKLKANIIAQIVAFSKGQTVNTSDRSKEFIGGRPSSLIYGQKLSPAALGALLGHFENKIMFQGFLWNINSFDQEGVQLGKILTQKILSGHADDPVLDAYTKILAVTV